VDSTAAPQRCNQRNSTPDCGYTDKEDFSTQRRKDAMTRDKAWFDTGGFNVWILRKSF
jgi:hypothetical protein